MSNKKIVIANWKMNLTAREGRDWLEEFNREKLTSVGQALIDPNRVDMVIIPSFTTLAQIADQLPTELALGAQNCYHQDSGAFTGEISISMLKELGVRYLLVGHSERRTLFGETDELINQKLQAVIAHGMIPVLCIGETLVERENQQWQAKLQQQLQLGLQNVTMTDGSTLIVAYEPVWAINTGRSATLSDVEEVNRFLRGVLAQLLGETVARAVRIVYGGSAKSSNSGTLLASNEIDGLLIGKASLNPSEFLKIAASACV